MFCNFLFFLIDFRSDQRRTSRMVSHCATNLRFSQFSCLTSCFSDLVFLEYDNFKCEYWDHPGLLVDEDHFWGELFGWSCRSSKKELRHKWHPMGAFSGTSIDERLQKVRLADCTAMDGTGQSIFYCAVHFKCHRMQQGKCLREISVSCCGQNERGKYSAATWGVSHEIFYISQTKRILCSLLVS